jgi:hypothetical protein
MKTAKELVEGLGPAELEHLRWMGARGGEVDGSPDGSGDPVAKSLAARAVPLVEHDLWGGRPKWRLTEAGAAAYTALGVGDRQEDR